MARRDALLRLHKTLLARRAMLRKAMAGVMDQPRPASGDSDMPVFDAGSDDIATQLAELEARELNVIEQALARMKQGTYGVCEVCQQKISISRLNALPYSRLCIECQRKTEGFISSPNDSPPPERLPEGG